MNIGMPGSDTLLNRPPDDSDFSFDDPLPSDSPASTTGKRVVPPLFLSPTEKRRADDLTPPGLSNPFWK